MSVAKGVLKSAVIAGAGPGGLATSLFLRSYGVHTTIVEKVDYSMLMEDRGGAWDLRPNTFKALQSVQLAEQITQRGERFKGVEARLPDGRTLARIEAPENFEARTIRRSALQRILLEAHGTEGLLCGAGVVGVDQTADEARVTLSDGRVVEGDLLIGADGVHSVVRKALLDDGPASFRKCMCWWGRLPYAQAQSAFPAGISTIMAGQGNCSVVGVVHGELVWTLFSKADTPSYIADPVQRKNELAKRASAWSPDLLEAVSRTHANDVGETAIWDRSPVKRWSAGRITLLGDAAHPMTPFLGQGANSAIVDGYVLAHFLRTQEVASALQSYERARMKNVYKNVLEARRLCTWMTSGAWFSDWMYRTMFRMIPARYARNSARQIDQANDLSFLPELA